MSDDNVMYDSPTEFLQDVASSGEECIAQSVLPNEDGTYRVACSCQHWTATAPSMTEGLRLARAHTGNEPLSAPAEPVRAAV